jgi:enterochelin esterase-like enzyme
MAAESRLDGWVPPFSGAASGGPCVPKLTNLAVGSAIEWPLMRRACLFLALFPVLATAQTPACTSTATGDLTILSFPNKTFGTAGFLNIWLPPGYASRANASRRYPVLYMLDGQILFDDCRGGIPEWHIDETLTRLIEAGSIDPLIVVGIDPGRRMHEFLPYKDTVFSPASPEPAGKLFPDFLANEVAPFIAARYRIEKGPQAIGGSSYGGVAALYATHAGA